MTSTDIASLKAAYLEQATAKIMAMPQANIVKDTYYRSVGDIACQALAFQISFLTDDDLANGIEPLLDLVTEEDLKTLLNDTPDDILDPIAGQISLFSVEHLKGRDWNTPRGENATEVMLGGYYGDYPHNRSHKYSSNGHCLNYAEKRVPGDTSTDEGTRLANVARYMVKRIRAALPAVPVDDTAVADGKIVFTGDLHHVITSPRHLIMMDRRNIDRIVEREVLAYQAACDAAKAVFSDDGSSTYADSDFSTAAVQSRINKRLQSHEKIVVTEASYDDKYKFWQINFHLINDTIRKSAIDRNRKKTETAAARLARAHAKRILQNDQVRIHATFARWLIRRIGMTKARALINRAVEARGNVITCPDSGVSAKFRDGIVLGCFTLSGRVRIKDHLLIIPAILPQTAINTIAAKAKAKMPATVADFITVENDDDLANALIKAAYNRSDGNTSLQMESRIIDVQEMNDIADELALPKAA